MACRQRDDLAALACEESIGTDDDSALTVANINYLLTELAAQGCLR
jgi:hypothetical protein